MAAVLLIEDDTGVAEPLAMVLDREGYPTDVRATAAEGMQALLAQPYELVILDLGLPDTDGVEMCRQIRQHVAADLPVLMLTARAEEIDVVVGLDAGADDYVTKPFRLAELLARVRALIRRTSPAPELAVGGLRIDVAARSATLDGRPLDLAPKEFELLSLLARHPGVTVERSRIVREVWDATVADSSRTVDTHMSMLRRRLATGADPLDIIAVRGVGFRLAPR